MDINRDFAKLTGKLKDSKEVEVNIKTLNSSEELFVYGLVAKGLSYINQTHLGSTLHMAVAELIRNAEKAVLKKLYFKEEDIDADAITEKNLRDFYHEYTGGLAKLRGLASRLKHIVVFQARLKEDELEFNIINAGAPTGDEVKFAQKSIATGTNGVDLNAINGIDLSTGEGEGKGLALTVMTLRRAGIPAENLSFVHDSAKTLFRISIPRTGLNTDYLKRIGKDLLAEVESLPTFPEHVKKIMDLCESDTSSAKQISAAIAKDASIAGQIIRLANSGGFAGGNVTGLEESVKIVGLTNVSGLLLKIGAFHILEERYGQSEDLLEHPIRVASYAKQLARKFRLGAQGDHAYVAGLLHDMGKIVLLATLPDRKTFQTLEKGRDRRSAVNLEELQCGVSHAFVGEMLARKWKFPEFLCAAIGFHHTPLEASEEQIDLVYLVYLANAIADYQREKMHFFAIEPEVLARFNLTNSESFEMLAANLAGMYGS